MKREMRGIFKLSYGAVQISLFCLGVMVMLHLKTTLIMVKKKIVLLLLLL